MENHKVYRAIGLMSGTSLDGHIDVALIETDGHDYVKPLEFYLHPYDIKARDAVRACFGKKTADKDTQKAEKWVTDVHIEAVKQSGFDADIIGFHGQTITHDPDNGFTWQLGDGERMAKECGIDTVSDFRTADVKAGGQGAPLAPLYHAARIKTLADDGTLEPPIAILNIGGVANVTCYGFTGALAAFDTGPGNALMDDFMRMKTGEAYDADGALAAKGQVHADMVEQWLDHEYYYKQPPKSLDRNEWDVWGVGPVAKDLNSLSVEDGLATLLEFTVKAVEKADDLIEVGANWYACGGGRHNAALMKRLDDTLVSGIRPVEDLGWNSDAIEAECFAYLAVRSKLGLPLSVSSTTGVADPQAGGVLHRAN